MTLICQGKAYAFALPDISAADMEAEDMGDRIVAPMPGVIKQINVKVGQSVSRDMPLAIMEAMKMEMTLSAPRDGVIAEVLVGEGDQVTDGDLLLSLEPVAE